MSAPADMVIGLSAVVVGMNGSEAAVLTVGEAPAALPFGPFDPEGHRTFELALRAFVRSQTGFELGYVEQLYTFGDRGRDAPVADVGAGPARVISVGYLALTARTGELPAPETQWAPWSVFFPWEDWRQGRPPVIGEHIAPGLAAWAAEAVAEERESRIARSRILFALEGAPWREERVLERYELLYEAGMVFEAARDRGDPGPAQAGALGRPMVSDHRRILATGLGRLRGKLRYRPVVFDLAPPEFTLSALQKIVEAITGVALHKQNFRRAVERAGLVEPLGRLRLDTGGRPAELFRFAHERAAMGPATGLPLPGLR